VKSNENNENFKQRNMNLYNFIFHSQNIPMSQNDIGNYNNNLNPDSSENLQIKPKKNKLIRINIENCEAISKINETEKQNYDIINDIKKNDFSNHTNKEAPFDKNHDLSKKIDNQKRNEKTELKKYNNSIFKSIGIYFIENPSGIKLYYNILHRKISFQEGNKIDNFFFQDVTDLVNYQINQLQENSKKQKIFAKISHEFKTPLNSIIGMISIIKNTEKLLSKSVNNNLEIISNLSNYVIYLVSDIIQYVNLKDINDLKIYVSELNFKEILKFGFEILNSLISCNLTKCEKISCCLSYDNKIEEFLAESDENRLKQIMLNFISNAVKFTWEGSIKLRCKLKNFGDKFFIKISVKDTGIGIKDEDKNKLFKDFGLIKIEGKTINNNFGSGLGLSICKSLSEKLDFKLEFKSEYLKGSKFSILIPCKIKSNSEIKIDMPEILLLSEKKNIINNDQIKHVINGSNNEALSYDFKIKTEEVKLIFNNEGPNEIKSRVSNSDLDNSYDNKIKKVGKYYF